MEATVQQRRRGRPSLAHTHMGPRRKKKEAVLMKEKRRLEFRNLVALMLMRIGKPGI